MDNCHASELAKRERCWDLEQRWRVLLDTIAWADAQQAISRNSPAACLKLQSRFQESYGSASSELTDLRQRQTTSTPSSHQESP